jgi:hypothetical protein
LLGLDYAGGRPSGAAIAAAGYGFVCRYLTAGGPGLPGKLLTGREYADLLASGVAVVCNWETTADRMKVGRAAGVSDAVNAEAVASDLGVPADRPIYFSADWDATPGDQVLIDAYLAGAASVLGVERVGVYGGYWVVTRCLDNGSARWAWQASAWSPTNPDGSRKVDPRAHLFQHVAAVLVGGVECDVNEALQPDYGQHPTIVNPGHRKDRSTMDQLPATAPPTNPNSDPATWPQRNFDIPFDLAGGWEGECAIVFGGQDWGGRTTDHTRSFLFLASWMLHDGTLVPVDATHTAKGGGQAVAAHTVAGPWQAPHGAIGITLNGAWPGGGYVATGRSA